MTDLVIPGAVLESARMSALELRRDVASMLYRRERLTLAQAARLAEMDRMQFQHVLASQGHAIHFSERDVDDEADAARDLLSDAT
ncbi:MAG: UPF0175 family protein [Bacteroidota bacterium]